MFSPVKLSNRKRNPKEIVFGLISLFVSKEFQMKFSDSFPAPRPLRLMSSGQLFDGSNAVCFWFLLDFKIQMSKFSDRNFRSIALSESDIYALNNSKYVLAKFHTRHWRLLPTSVCYRLLARILHRKWISSTRSVTRSVELDILAQNTFKLHKPPRQKASQAPQAEVLAKIVIFERGQTIISRDY